MKKVKKIEKMKFAEFVSQCDVSHWEANHINPIVRYGNYAVVEVVPANDPDFFIREEKGEIIVDWGEPVILLDDPYQTAYTIYHYSDGSWRCIGSLYATLEEAREILGGEEDGTEM